MLPCLCSSLQSNQSYQVKSECLKRWLVLYMLIIKSSAQPSHKFLTDHFNINNYHWEIAQNISEWDIKPIYRMQERLCLVTKLNLWNTNRQMFFCAVGRLPGLSSSRLEASSFIVSIFRLLSSSASICWFSDIVL